MLLYNKIYFSDNLKKVFIALLLFNCLVSSAQLFDQPANMSLVRKGAFYIYNVQPDTALLYIDSVEQRLPQHPVVPLMRAMNVLWSNIPVVTVDSVFGIFSGYLRETIKRSIRLDGGRQEHPEAIFFEMTARGLLAEYYADDGHYMKAFGEASKAYDLIKDGFDLTEEIPEFLLTTGIYNYFREKYPEKYPVYKPLLWFFKSGDVELGLAQIKKATEKGVLTQVEAYIYLAYIYLRYEYEPKMAQSYLWKLTASYPRNPYIKAKLLESLTPNDDFVKAPVSYIDELVASDRAYYKMAGDAFYGLRYEKVLKDLPKAMVFYKKAINAGSDILGHGDYYRYMSYLGIGRIYMQKGANEEAKYHLKMVMDNSESEDLLKEAQEMLHKL